MLEKKAMFNKRETNKKEQSGKYLWERDLVLLM